MGFFRKYFGSKKDDDHSEGSSDLTPEEFFDTDYIKGLLHKYKRVTTLLRPHKSKSEIGQQESKFGGTPDFTLPHTPITSSQQ
jgi:hypothetical protein